MESEEFPGKASRDLRNRERTSQPSRPCTNRPRDALLAVFRTEKTTTKKMYEKRRRRFLGTAKGKANAAFQKSCRAWTAAGVTNAKSGFPEGGDTG